MFIKRTVFAYLRVHEVVYMHISFIFVVLFHDRRTHPVTGGFCVSREREYGGARKYGKKDTLHYIKSSNPARKAKNKVSNKAKIVSLNPQAANRRVPRVSFPETIDRSHSFP